MSENFKPEWYPNIDGEEETKKIKVAKVTKVSKRKNLYRVMGLSAPLLAAGVILAAAQPPSSSLSTPNAQVNSAIATDIQSTVASASSLQKSTHKTTLSTTPSSTPSLPSGGKKPSISGSAAGDDSESE